MNTIGSGPIKFSAATQKSYEEYLERQTPMAFAVTTDGSASYWYYCPWNAMGSCEHLADTQVIYDCEKRYPGKTCKVFAHKRTVVWENPGDFLAAASATPRGSSRARNKGTQQKREGSVTWDGVGRFNFDADVYLTDSGGFSSIRMKNGPACEVTFRYQGTRSANWNGTCDNGEKVKGNLRYDPKKGTSRAIGRDTKDRIITIESQPTTE